MPKHADDQPKKAITCPASPKSRFSQTESNLPMTDSFQWIKSFLEADTEGRTAALKKAADEKDAAAVDNLLEIIFNRINIDIDEIDIEIRDLENGIDDLQIGSTIGEIGVNEAQFSGLMERFCRGSTYDRVMACYTLSILADEDAEGHRTKLVRAIPQLVDGLDDKDDSIRMNSAYALGRLGHKDAIPKLRQLTTDGYNDVAATAIRALGDLGDKDSIPFLKSLLNRTNGEKEEDAAIYALNRLGVPEEEIQKEIDSLSEARLQDETEDTDDVDLDIGDYEVDEDEIDYSGYSKSPDARAIYERLCQSRDLKTAIFENASFLDALPDRQAWITINDPQSAKDVIKLLVEELGKKRGSLDSVLKSRLGVGLKQLQDAHYTYYADEILDAAALVAKNAGLAEDAETSSVLSKIRYGGGGIRLRYFRREKADLSLGDKCGDCTAKGSMNFENSTSWITNPAYQILKMSKGKRFIGRVNLALGTFAGKDAIIIDALEFNPQSKQGMPYYEDGLECFKEALDFLKELAGRENRTLIAYRASNSSGAMSILRNQGRPIKSQKQQVSLKLVIPKEDISRCFYFQVLGTTVDSKSAEPRRHDLELVMEVEADVILPAMRDNEEVAAAMRDRDFERASSLIMDDCETNRKVKERYFPGIGPKDASISPKWLLPILQQLYKADAVDEKYVSKEFMVHSVSFVEL